MDQTYYRTGSLQAAAFLVATGHKMEKHVDNGRFIEFVFSENNGDIREAVAQYHKGAICVAIGFYRALADLKQIVFNTRKAGAR